MSKPTSPINPHLTETYRTIASRLADLSPSLYIDDHIYSSLKAGRTILVGISFVPKNAETLKQAFRNVTDFRGNQFFAEGSNADPAHWDNQGDPNNWPLRLSFAKTPGVGFREIWRPHLRGLNIDDAQTNRVPQVWNRGFSGQFNAPIDNSQSSLHCSIAPDICNIHIDEMGFVITGPNGEIIVGPDFVQHTVNELLFKTNLEHKWPDWIIERMSIELPNSTNGYSRVGVSGDIIQRKDLLFRGTASCSVLPPFDCSIALSLSGTHDLLGGH